ncbi:MAG: DUF3047 domain-containing protein [Gammaproteobacteria bacterium]
MLTLLLMLIALPGAGEVRAEILEINPQTAQHIQFKRIAPSQYQFEAQSLRIQVDDSASFLLVPFKQIKTVSTVRYQWTLESGDLRLNDAAHEASRDGDDAVFKLGLLIEGDPGFSNPLAPKWLKQANAALTYPSDRMIYIVANAKHHAGQSWTSPYNDKIQMTAAQNRPLDAGWIEASHVFDSPANVVGLWLMADGDNTDSRFSVRVKNIELE